MRKLFDDGTAFFIVAALSMLTALIADRPAVFISLSIAWFILGVAVRKKHVSEAAGEARDTDATPPAPGRDAPPS